MIILTQKGTDYSTCINPAQVVYVADEEGDTVIYFTDNSYLTVKESYLDVVGELKAQSQGCCR